ncbi:MAG: class I SAM-dependent methyltransferase [Actinomycetota bacterium]|nr:class I SAM-dependent methyltransferase [Actinomycetota bacterium]
MLEEAQALGFLGPGPVEAHVDHAAGFAAVVEAAWADEEETAQAPSRAGDLGSGAGLPGLPLALHLPTTRWALIESGVRRAALLRRAVTELGLESRVEVVEARAEVVGRHPGLRGQLDLVVARGFGPPGAVAECAAPLLRVGGRAVVSEPPGGDPDRWPEEGLSLVGMARGRSMAAGGSTYQVLGQVAPCPARYPRRVGVPAKRPLF